jgi:hypothetical protein
MSKRPTPNPLSLNAAQPEGCSAKGPSSPKTGTRIRGVHALSAVDVARGTRHVTVLYRVSWAPDSPGSCPADHRSGLAGHAAPEGAALLDPKASLTWLSPSVPLTPLRSPPEGDRAGFALRCPLAARRQPRFTGDHSHPKAKVTAFPVQHPSRSKVPLRAGGRGFAPRRSLSVGCVGLPTLLPLTEFDSSFRV